MSSTPGATAASSSSKSKATGGSQAPEKRKPLFQKECNFDFFFLSKHSLGYSVTIGVCGNNEFFFFFDDSQCSI